MKHAVKTILFLLILWIILIELSILFREKSLSESNREPITEWVREFLELPKNSVDILFLGSSQSFCSINPLILWKEEGISAYSLGSSAQDIYATKAYLEEALQSQKPKLVFLEVRNLVMLEKAEERWNRVAYDNLPFSFHKLSNIRASMQKEESFISYIFPVLRFHDRWKELNQSDFKYLLGTIELSSGYLGYYPRFQITKANIDNFYTQEIKKFSMSERVKTAVKEIKAICEKEGIELLLWKAPAPMWRSYYSDALKEFADSLEVPFIDLNLEIDTLGLNSNLDFYDSESHLNDSGATKVSKYLANWLKETKKLTDYRGSTKYQAYNDKYHLYLIEKIASVTKLEVYLELITEPEFDVFFCVNDGMGDITSYKETLQNLPFKNLTKAAGICSYAGILSGTEGVVFDVVKEEQEVFYKGVFNGMQVELRSQGYHAGDNGSIQINGAEYLPKGQRGLGIVVYDRKSGKVIDAVTFDTAQNGAAYRTKELPGPEE